MNPKGFCLSNTPLGLSPMLYNLLRPKFTNICNKLECLSPATLIWCLWVNHGAYTERCFTKLGTGLTRCRLGLKGFAMGKHSSLIRAFVDYGLNSYITFKPGLSGRTSEPALVKWLVFDTEMLSFRSCDLKHLLKHIKSQNIVHLVTYTHSNRQLKIYNDKQR